MLGQQGKLTANSRNILRYEFAGGKTNEHLLDHSQRLDPPRTAHPPGKFSGPDASAPPVPRPCSVFSGPTRPPCGFRRRRTGPTSFHLPASPPSPPPPPKLQPPTPAANPPRPLPPLVAPSMLLVLCLLPPPPPVLGFRFCSRSCPYSQPWTSPPTGAEPLVAPFPLMLELPLSLGLPRQQEYSSHRWRWHRRRRCGPPPPPFPPSTLPCPASP